MRKWGVVISAFYALVLLALFGPAYLLLSQDQFNGWPRFLKDLMEGYESWGFWIFVGMLLGSQALLLFLSVDTSESRLKPRAHVLISVALSALLTAILTSALIWSLALAIRGDNLFDSMGNLSKTLLGSRNDDYFAIFWTLVFWAALWLLWGILFYLYFRNSSEVVTRTISWLLKGSILELLVVVPCHVIVRRRHDCSAPVVTSFGIVTGIAIMLLSFGPSVLFLYKKRLDAYAARSSP